MLLAREKLKKQGLFVPMYPKKRYLGLPYHAYMWLVP